MERKFNLFDDVNISTEAGNVKGYVTNYSFSKVSRSYKYDVSDYEGKAHHVDESLLEKYRETAESIIADAKKDYRMSHADSPYEPYYVIGALKVRYDQLMDKYEKLEEKYKVLKMNQEVLNPIS